MPTCPNCGVRLPARVPRYCPECHEPLDDDPPPRRRPRPPRRLVLWFFLGGAGLGFLQGLPGALAAARNQDAAYALGHAAVGAFLGAMIGLVIGLVVDAQRQSAARR